MLYSVHFAWVAFAVVGFLLAGDRYSRARSALVFVLLMILAVLAGTHSQGSDFPAYVRFFSRYLTFDDVNPGEYPEFGFQALLALANSLSLSFGVTFSLLAGVSLGVLGLAVRRISANDSLYFFLYVPKYYFQGHINQVRSSLIYPFAVLSIDWLSRGKNGRVILCGLLLSTIHASAALLCLLPLLRPIRLSYRTLIPVLLLPFAASIVMPSIIQGVWDLTGIRQFGYVAATHETVPLLSIEVFRRLVLYGMIGYLVYDGRVEEDVVFQWVAKFFLLSWVFYIGFIGIRVISDRLGALFGVVEPLVLLTFARIFVADQRLLWMLFLILLGALEFWLRAVPLKDVPVYIPYWKVVDV